jgi:hypothetical protein
MLKEESNQDLVMLVHGSHLCHSPPSRPSIPATACFFTFAAMPHALTQPQLLSPRDQTKSWSDASLALQDAAATSYTSPPAAGLVGAGAAKAGSCEQDSPPGLTLAGPQEKAVSCCACHCTPRGCCDFARASTLAGPHADGTCSRGRESAQWCSAASAGKQPTKNGASSRWLRA